MKIGLTAHMIVKNEDQWVRYSLLSILPYVDTVLVTDTGSTDHTIEAISSLKSPKVKLTIAHATSAIEVTQLRQAQLNRTKTDWFWIVDGDEIYPEKTAKEVVRAVNGGRYEGIVVRRYDLLGDIYHRQVESVGAYQLFGHRGHLVTRLLNKAKINGLHYRGSYPNEGFYDASGHSTRDRNPKNWYITHDYLFHAMYLRRSSLGSTLAMLNRNKYKVETGITLKTSLPAVFQDYSPLAWEPDPLAKRSLAYELTANMLTPLKQLKRKFR